MARYPEGHKEETRARIVEAASAAYRQQGLAGIGIQALMRTLGLTHGGFYSHFDNRDELITAALDHAAEQVGSRLWAWVEQQQEQPFEHLVQQYLSELHRDHPEAGCPIATLGVDAVREGPVVREKISLLTQGFLANITRAMRADAPGAPVSYAASKLSDEAIAAGVVLVGSLVLSRAVGPSLSKRVLAVGRRVAMATAQSAQQPSKHSSDLSHVTRYSRSPSASFVLFD